MSTITGGQPTTTQTWTWIARGIVSVLFGLLLLATPLISLLAIIWLFGIFAIIEGITAMIVAFIRRKTSPRWWVLLIGGVVGIALGIVALVWPGITALALLYVIAIWAIVTGFFEVATAFTAGPAIPMAYEWALVFSGVLSVVLGIILLSIHPLRGILALVWLLGIYAIIYGIVVLVRGVQSRGREAVAA